LSAGEEPMPDFAIERRCEGIVCGIDEAGRGPLAGPVVAAAVIIDRRRFRGELTGTEGDCARIRRDDAAENPEILLRIDDMMEAKLVLTDALVAESLRKSKQNQRKGD